MNSGEYISMDEVAKRLRVTRGTVHYYLRVLKIKTQKFPLDKHAYLSAEDFETIRKLKEGAESRAPKENAA